MFPLPILSPAVPVSGLGRAVVSRVLVVLGLRSESRVLTRYVARGSASRVEGMTEMVRGCAVSLVSPMTVFAKTAVKYVDRVA